MANSRSIAPLGVGSLRRGSKLIPSRTPGPLGRLDAGDPDIRTKSGDTPRSLGVQHHAGLKRHSRRRHHISGSGHNALKGTTPEVGKLATFVHMAAEFGEEPWGISGVASEAASDVVARSSAGDGPPAENAPPQPQPQPGSAVSRFQMAQWIVNQEARRDAQGRLKVYKLPANDGGGRFEVAGISERYDNTKCLQLVAMLNAGQHAAAEREAAQYIASKTDAAANWTRLPAAELFLRDTIFNRGLGGATKILQMALGGVARSQFATAILEAEQNPRNFIQRLRAAREQYEWKVVGRRANLVTGLINRWNHARDEALSLIT